MTTIAAVIGVLAIASAACGLVSVAAMWVQRRGADHAGVLLDEGWIIDGGTLGDPADEPPPSDHHMESHLGRIISLQRPGVVAIVFALLGVVLAASAGVLSFYQ